MAGWEGFKIAFSHVYLLLAYTPNKGFIDHICLLVTLYVSRTMFCPLYESRTRPFLLTKKSVAKTVLSGFKTQEAVLSFLIKLVLSCSANTPYSKMAAVSDELGRIAWKRGIEGQTPVFTNALRGKDFFPHISWGKKVIYEMDRRYSKRYRQTFPSDKAHKCLLESFQAIALSSFTCGA